MKKNHIKLIIIFLINIFCISSIYLFVNIYGIYSDTKNNDELAEEIRNNQTNKEIKDIADNSENNKSEKVENLKIIQNENSDIKAWLEIEGTNINYPVLQTTNNDFYLTHNHKKEHSKNGSIFLDKDVDINKPSTNFLIYGHNKNIKGQLFEELMNYKNEEYYKTHPNIKLITNEGEFEYEIISVFLSRVYYKKETDVFRYYYFINAKNKEEYENFIENCKKEAIYETKKSARYNEQLLTLSTCEYSKKDGRLAIVAKKKENKKL